MIAITGATGFLGGYIAERLPFPQVRLSRKPGIECKDCTWIKGDLNNILDIERFVPQAEVLIHFACTSNCRTSNQNISADIEQNLISTINLLNIFSQKHPGGHVIFSSSGGAMYELNISKSPRTEMDPPVPRSSYGIIKYTIEQYLRQYCEMKRIRATVFRISNPYGVLHSIKRGQGLIGVTFAKLLANEELTLFDSLDSVRDYIHLDDLVRAFQLTLKYPPAIGEMQVFNLGSGQGYSNREVLNFIERQMKLKINKKILDNIPSPTWNVLSYNKIEQALGWKPTIELAKGIELMHKTIQISI